MAVFIWSGWMGKDVASNSDGRVYGAVRTEKRHKHSFMLTTLPNTWRMRAVLRHLC